MSANPFANKASKEPISLAAVFAIKSQQENIQPTIANTQPSQIPAQHKQIKKAVGEHHGQQVRQSENNSSLRDNAWTNRINQPIAETTLRPKIPNIFENASGTSQISREVDVVPENTKVQDQTKGEKFIEIILIHKLGKSQVNFISQKQLLQKTAFTFDGLRTSREFQSRSKTIRLQTKRENNCINLTLGFSSVQILAMVEKVPDRPLESNLINRLLQGFLFFEFQKQRDQIFGKLIRQNIETKRNENFWQGVDQLSTRFSIDRAMTVYLLLAKPNIDLNDKREAQKFFLEQCIWLLKTYVQLNKFKRLSAHKIIKKHNEIYILKQIFEHYTRKFSQNCKIDDSKTKEMGYLIIALLDLILVTHSESVSEDELTALLPAIQSISQAVAASKELYKQTNAFYLRLYMRFKNRANVGCLRLGPIASFIEYYMDQYRQGDPAVLNNIMVGLNLINQYQPGMLELVRSKFENFVKQMESCIDMNPQRMLLTAMECILLIKETRKTILQKQTNSSLLKILFRNCPLAFFSFIDNLDTHSELSLSFAVQNSKRSRQSKAPMISVSQLNKSLPESYHIAQSPQSLALSKFLLSLIIKYGQGARTVTSFIYQSLEDIEKTLEKFSIRVDGGDTMQLIELVCRYIKQYCFQDHRNESDTIQLIGRVHDSINCLINYFYEAKQLYKLMANIKKLSMCVIDLASPTQSTHNAVNICEEYSKLMNIPLKVQQVFELDNQEQLTMISKCCGALYQQFGLAVDTRKQAVAVYTGRNGMLTNSIVSLLTLAAILQLFENSQGVQIDRLIANVTGNSINSKIIAVSLDLLDNGQKHSKQYDMLADTVVAVVHQIFKMGSHEDGDKSQLKQVLEALIVQHPVTLAQLCITKLQLATTMSTPKQIDLMLACSEVLHRLLESATHEFNMRSSLHLKVTTKPSLLSNIWSSDGNTMQQSMQLVVKSVMGSGVTKPHMQLQIMLCLIAIQFDNNLLDVIKVMGFAEDLAHKAVTLLGLQTSLIQTKNRVRMAQQLNLVCRCLNVFEGLFKSGWAKVDEYTGRVLTKSLSIFIFHNTNSNYTNTRGWLHMLLSYFVVWQSNSYQLIIPILQHFSKCSTADSSLEMSVTLIQLLAVYLKVVKFGAMSTLQVENKKQSLDTLIDLIIVIINGLMADPGDSPIGDYELKQAPKLVPVVFVAAIKIIQKVKLYYVLHQQTCISPNLLSLIDAMRKFSKCQIYLTLAEQQQRRVQQMLSSIAQLLDQEARFTIKQQGKDRTAAKNSYNLVYFHYTESLVHACMTRRQSFLSFFSGVIQEIIDIHRDRNKRTSKEQNSYRQHYLLYCFLQRIIESETGQFVTLMYEQEPALDSPTKLAPTFSQSMLSMIQLIIQSLPQTTPCGIVQLTWGIIILHRFLQLHPSIAHGVRCLKILEHCGRYLELLNRGQSRKHKEKRSGGQDDEGLQHWVGYVQVVGILIILYRMHRHCHLEYDNVFGFLRTLIFDKIEDMNSNSLKLESRNNKFQQFRLQPTLKCVESTRAKQYLQQSIITSIVSQASIQPSGFHQQINSNSPNNDPEKKLSLERFLEINLMMVAMFNLLLYCRFDRFAIGAQWKLMKSQLASNLVEILAKYANIYDNFFSKNSTGRDQSEQQNAKGQQNTEMLESVLKGYINSGQISSDQHYLNKVMGEYLLMKHLQNSRKLAVKITLPSHLASIDMKETIGVPWYKSSEDILMALGHKVSNKFHVFNSRMGGSRMMSMSRDRKKSKSSRYYYN